jgi:hypothetical protein
VIIEVALVNERRSTFRLPLSATRHSGRFATRAYRLNYWLSTRKILDFYQLSERIAWSLRYAQLSNRQPPLAGTPTLIFRFSWIAPVVERIM